MSELSIRGPEPTAELAELDREEQAISRQRRLIHQRIDRLYLSAPLDDAQVSELDELETLEQEVSNERYRLHRRIDEVRQQIGLPPWRADAQSNAA